MSRILIDHEGMRGTAHELRAIDAELDALRGRLRGAALGAMPPDVIARIGATTGRADVVLHGHGERLRVEAGRLEWRAAAAEVAGGTNPTLRGSFDFLDRSGLLALASFAGVVPNARVAYDAFSTFNDRVGQAGSLYLSADASRQAWVNAGRHGVLGGVSSFGHRAWTPLAHGARSARAISGKIGKVTGWANTAFTAADIFKERTGRGQGVGHAAAATAGIMGSQVAGTVAGGAVGAKVGMVAGATVGSLLGPAGTLVGGAVGGFVGGAAGGWIGREIGERIGEWGVGQAEEAIGSALHSAEYLAEDVRRVVSDVPDRAGDAMADVGNIVKDKLKFW